MGGGGFGQVTAEKYFKTEEQTSQAGVKCRQQQQVGGSKERKNHTFRWQSSKIFDWLNNLVSQSSAMDAGQAVLICGIIFAFLRSFTSAGKIELLQ